MAKRKPLQEAPMRRSEIVTVRLDPRLKHLAEIAARKQRRTLSGYIEWAVERSLSNVVLKEGPSTNVTVADAERMYQMWDVDEAERVTKLALRFPELLTFDEQLVWRLVRDHGAFWGAKLNRDRTHWEWSPTFENLVWGRVREHWSTLKRVAVGELPTSALPAVDHYGSPAEDDIPF